MKLTKDNLSVLLPQLNIIQIRAIKQFAASERREELVLFYANTPADDEKMFAHYDARNAQLIKEMENYGWNT